MASNEALRGLKICFVFGSLELGGAERRGVLLADYLKRVCGADVHVLGLSDSPGRLSKFCDEFGIEWSGVPFHWGLKRRIPSFLAAVRALRDLSPQVLISYTRVPNLVCAFGWKRVGAKLCVWNQADEGLLMNGLPHYRLAVRLPHCIISNSAGGKDFLIRTYGRAAGEIDVICNGIAAASPKIEKDAWRRALEVAPGSPLVCMIAHLSVYKDHRTLVKAWRDVLDRGQFTTPPVLVLGGRFDGEEKGVLQLAAQMGVADSIRLPGQIDDVAGLLAAADLFVFSSRSEGIPNAVLEAMAAGVAVVGTDIPGIREAVGPGGCDYLAAVGDSSAMADKILSLLRNTELRQDLGRSLRKRIEDEFTLEKMCRRYVASITALLTQRKKR